MAQAQVDISSQLEVARTKYHLPGLMAMVIKNGRIAGQGATGFRRFGLPAALQLTDRVNIGSNTKYMTANVIARLIDKGQLSWDTRVRDVFANYQEFRQEYHNATLQTILGHRSGLPDGAYWDGQHLAEYRLVQGSIAELRLWTANTILKDPPQVPPGQFIYSNQGFTVASVMAELVTGKSWEVLMREEVFQPVNMHSAGFEPANGDISSDSRVVGHYVLAGNSQPEPRAPNLGQSLGHYQASTGPGGLVSCTFTDFAKWIHFQTSHETNGYLEPETYAKFLQGYGGVDGYGVGVWVYARPWASPGPGLSHNGQILLQSSSVYWSPAQNLIFLFYSNCRTSDDSVFTAFQSVFTPLITQFAGAAASGPHLESPTTRSWARDGNTLRFRFESLPGSSYRLETSSQLNGWTQAPNTPDLLAPATEGEFLIPISGLEGFFRVRAIP